jgi:glycosyltransferase involved in cell wall biosynthesis
MVIKGVTLMPGRDDWCARAPECRELPLISICVCTYRRGDLLLALLHSLARQRRDDFALEVILVDNDALASARPLALRARLLYPGLSLRYRVEPRQGISFARNLSVALARGDYLAFIDDDEQASPDWLSQLWRTLCLSGADGVFGPVLPAYVANTPAWVIRGGFFQRPRFPTGSRIRFDARCGNGLLRARLIQSLLPSPFDPALAFSGGEDAALFYFLAQRGARYVWCDQACIQETVPRERQTLRWILGRSLRSSIVYWRLRYAQQHWRYRLSMALFGLAMFIGLGALGLLLSPGGLLHAARLWARACKGLGRVLALSAIKLDGYRAAPSGS